MDEVFFHEWEVTLGVSGGAKGDDFRFQLRLLVQGEQADGDWEVEAAWAAGAGVEVEDAALAGDAGGVGVSVKDGGEFGGGGIEVEGVEVVEQVEVADRMRRDFDGDDFGCGEFGARAGVVDVAADGGYGGDFAEVVEDGDFAYVAEVEDALDPGEGGEDFGPEEAMGVADESDFHLDFR